MNKDNQKPLQIEFRDYSYGYLGFLEHNLTFDLLLFLVVILVRITRIFRSVVIIIPL